MWTPWHLMRSPLAPGVPLEGTDTVAGLRMLERQRLSQLLSSVDPGGDGGRGGAAAGGPAAAAAGGGWRRSFQRYRGPFIEHLTTEDLKAAPKSWGVFWKGSERGDWTQVRRAWRATGLIDAGPCLAPLVHARPWR